MAKIEINGSDDELKRISIFLKNNNIKHIINDDFIKDESSKLNKKESLEHMFKHVRKS